MRSRLPERSRDVERPASEALDPLWMRAALLKQVGQAQKADQLLRQHLAFLEGDQDSGAPMRLGWSRFIAQALIGERQAALDELERIAGTPYHHQWYDLKTYYVDPDYAAVVGDPPLRCDLRPHQGPGRHDARGVFEVRVSFVA